MTVQQNVEYGLRVRKVAKAERRSRASEVLSLVRLEGFGDRKPAQLSGGQRQRVALARAIVNTPQALLLDEPLGALDLKLRQELQIELKQLQQELGMTFVYVTHDQEEALTMSDRIAVFNQGRIEQIGTPARDVRAPGDGVRRRLHRHVEHARAGRADASPCARRRSAYSRSRRSEGEPGTVRAAVYLGAATKFVVALDSGGELTCVQQNLETRSRGHPSHGGQAGPAALEPDVEFVIEEEGT